MVKYKVLYQVSMSFIRFTFLMTTGQQSVNLCSDVPDSPILELEFRNTTFTEFWLPKCIFVCFYGQLVERNH